MEQLSVPRRELAFLFYDGELYLGRDHPSIAAEVLGPPVGAGSINWNAPMLWGGIYRKNGGRVVLYDSDFFDDFQSFTLREKAEEALRKELGNLEIIGKKLAKNKVVWVNQPFTGAPIAFGYFNSTLYLGSDHPRIFNHAVKSVLPANYIETDPGARSPLKLKNQWLHIPQAWGNLHFRADGSVDYLFFSDTMTWGVDEIQSEALEVLREAFPTLKLGEIATPEPGTAFFYLKETDELLWGRSHEELFNFLLAPHLDESDDVVMGRVWGTTEDPGVQLFTWVDEALEAHIVEMVLSDPRMYEELERENRWTESLMEL